MDTWSLAEEEAEALAAQAIDLDDEDRPRSLRQCEQEMPAIIAACAAHPGPAEAEAVCDWCRSLLAAHLRERGNSERVRGLLRESAAVVSRAAAHLPRERATHFLENIYFRIELTDTLEQHGVAAVLALLTQRQITMAGRLINQEPAATAVPPCQTFSME